MGSGPKSNRRQFLKGKAALDALQDLQWGSQGPLAGDAPPRSARAHAERRDYLLHVSRRAMACEFQIFLNPGQHAGAIEAATESLDLVDALEEQMTVYRGHSEIMQINRMAAAEPAVVEPRLYELLSRCKQWTVGTGGAFDITSGPLIKLWGFYTRQGRFPDQEEVQATLQRVGSEYLELDDERRTIRFARPGMELNLGSVGKGYALDRCAEVLDAAGVEDYLIHGGQSSILARGCRHDTSEIAPWCIAVRHPLRSQRRLAELIVRDRAVGTSGSGQQFFYHRGRRYGHVLDPRTGAPAEGVLSATVLAPSAAEADALATSFFVMGVDEVHAYCQTHPELSALFVLAGSRQGTVAIETLALDQDLTLLEE